MPNIIPQSFITEKNKAANAPIMLYEISIPTPPSTLRLCEWDTIIHYPTSGGYDYIPFPLKHEGISCNALGEIDSVKVRLSSVDRSIISALITNNGLIGSKVVMKLVFLDQLADATAFVSSTFYIDSVDTTEKEAIFSLSSKLDLYEVQIPARDFQRDHCQWFFKSEGCYLGNAGVYTPPPGFVNGSVECDHSRVGTVGCRYHGNSSRFGGFPAIPQRGLYVA